VDVDKDSEDRLDRSCEKRRSITKSKEGQKYLTCDEYQEHF